MSSPESAKATETTASISTEKLEQLASEVEKALREGHADTLPPETVQAMFAVACRLYSAQLEAGAEYLPLPSNSKVTATDIMMASSGLLKAGNLQVFELGMWVSYTGR
jgi:DNA-binding PucR family transcriptional regulator